MRLTKAVVVCGLLAALGFLARCGKTTDDGGRTRVVATLFATYDFARVVAGPDAEVTLLLPPGVEAHHFDPRPADVATVARSRVFIHTGKAMEPWVDRFLAAAGRPDLLVLDLGLDGPVGPPAGKDTVAESDAHAGDHDHDHDANHRDPHTWLDLAVAQRMVGLIAETLAKADPVHAAAYRARAVDYQGLLAALDGRYRQTLDGFSCREIIYGGHFAFGHLARRYGLTVTCVIPDFAPNAEASPQAIRMLIDHVRRNGARAVFHEELVEPRVAAVIARETGVELLLLHGCHNVAADDLKRGVGYLSLMEANLAALAKGLGSAGR